MGWVVALGNRRLSSSSPPLWDCQRWGLLEESSCPKNTLTYSPKSQVKTPNRWLRLISGLIYALLNPIPLHVAITQHSKLVLDLTDLQTSTYSQTDALSSILTPSSAPKRVFRLPTGMLHKNTICYLQRNICKWRMNRLAIRSMSDPSAALPFRDRNMNQELD